MQKQQLKHYRTSYGRLCNFMNKLQAFYKSRRWENFVETLRIERADASGLIHCEHCGQPITKKYDCIGHHVTELTEDNVDDVTIALNPDNVKLVHFRCHNEIHKRFGYAGRLMQKVFIVYGAPCAGKRTFVESVAEPGDLILDLDKVWAAVRASSCGEYEKPGELKANVFGIRDCLIDMIKVRRGRWANAYIIGGYPLQGERERLAEQVGAEKMIFIDTPKDVCLLRAQQKPSEFIQFVNDWFEKYRPPVEG